jgi:hypothetical protein
VIPVDQVRVGVPAGQCTEAALASVLEIPLDAVPDLWGGQGADEPRPVRRWVQFLGLVLAHGLQYVQYNTDPTPTAEVDLDALGLPREARFCARGFHLLAGENPDGLGHMCVGHNGKLVHDPNPSRRGLVTVDAIVVLIPLDMIEDGLFHWVMRDYRRVDGVWKLTTSD